MIEEARSLSSSCCAKPRARSKRTGLSMCLFFVLMSGGGTGSAQQKASALDLLRLASNGSPELAHSIEQTFTTTELQEGRVFKSHLSSVFFAIESASKPALMIDGQIIEDITPERADEIIARCRKEADAHTAHG